MHLRQATLAALALALPLSSPAATVFYIGTNNGSTSEFEQEGSTRNDRNYYWENGDFSTITGLNGAGLNWTTGMEIWQDPRTTHGGVDDPYDISNPGHTAGQHASLDDAQTLAGFPRAITNGWTTNNIFFLLDPTEVGPGMQLVFELDISGGGFGATATETLHDLEFTLNGDVFLTLTGVTSTTGLITATIDASALSSGPAVLSWERTGGATGSNWVTFDYTSLTSQAVPEPSRACIIGLALTGVLLRRRR